jgi:hypothetical protein
VDSTEAARLLHYVEKGNRLLIAGNYFPFELMMPLVPPGGTVRAYWERRDAEAVVHYMAGSVPYPGQSVFHYRHLKDTVAHTWNFFRNDYFSDTLALYHFKPISFLNDSAVIACSIDHGNGRIILHANPILFTNLYMTGSNGHHHMSNLLSLLQEGTTYWDDPYAVQGHNAQEARGNPLRFLFSHPHLMWAWYLFLFTIILYIIFRSKREQRVISLMPVNTNASIEYTKAIGTLYYQKKGHHHLANELYTIFLAEIRGRYNIFTDIEEKELIDQLSARSGISRNILYNLFRQFQYVRSDREANGDDLINLYNAIEYYHKKRK